MKVAIVGTAPTWREAPIGDPEWEIWSLSRNYLRMEDQWDRWFELHKLEEVAKSWEASDDPASEAAARATYIEWLAQAAQKRTVYVREPRPEVPGAEVFPADALLARFPRQYFTNTVSWMMALAIHEGADEIGLWGVNMELDSEYGEQRPSCEYYIGLIDGLAAAGEMAAPCHLPEHSTLLRTAWQYGIEDPPPMVAAVRARKSAIAQKKAEVEAQEMATKIQIAALTGAEEITNWVQRNWFINGG